MDKEEINEEKQRLTDGLESTISTANPVCLSKSKKSRKLFITSWDSPFRTLQSIALCVALYVVVILIPVLAYALSSRGRHSSHTLTVIIVAIWFIVLTWQCFNHPVKVELYQNRVVTRLKLYGKTIVPLDFIAKTELSTPAQPLHFVYAFFNPLRISDLSKQVSIASTDRMRFWGTRVCVEDPQAFQDRVWDVKSKQTNNKTSPEP